MPVIVKSKKGDSNSSLIRRFKKAVFNQDIVQRARDRRYYQKPSEVRAQKNSEKKHLRKKLKTLKKMKNVSPQSLRRLREKINSL